MTDGIDQTRRTLLTLGAVALAGSAGCATDDTGSAGSGDDAASKTTGPSGDTATRSVGTTARETAATATASRSDTETATLDLREANVTGVSVEQGDGSHRFSVTLYHDDDGEEGYANWWQVETLDGERLGRRELLHAHSTAPFTRSETVEIPSEISCVVVRGHDQTHEYGGRAMVVSLDSGATRGVDQGSEPQSFSDAECP